MPSTRWIIEMRLPESSTPSVLNSTIVLGVRRSALPSSNSISARPRSRVLTCVPCVMGRLRNALSNPMPVFLLICTEPCTSLRRTMRACEPARAGSARSTQAAAVRRTMLILESDSLDISNPQRSSLPIRARFGKNNCKNLCPGGYRLAARGRGVAILNPSASWSRSRAHFHESLCPRPHHVEHRTVVVNFLQKRLYGLQFQEVTTLGLVFHVFQLVVEGKLLVAMVVGKTASELQRRAHALKQSRQLLDGRQGRKIVSRGSFLRPIFVGQLLVAGEGQLAIARIDLARKVMGLRGQLENPGARGVREAEFRLVGLALVRVGRDFRHTFIAGVAVGLHCNGIVFGFGVGKVQRESNRGGLGCTS